jgi:hypothetical protein
MSAEKERFFLHFGQKLLRKKTEIFRGNRYEIMFKKLPMLHPKAKIKAARIK